MLAKLLDEKMVPYSAAAAAVLLAGGTSAKAAIQGTALSPHVTLTGPNSRYPIDFNVDGATDVSIHLLTTSGSSSRTDYQRYWDTTTFDLTMGSCQVGTALPAALPAALNLGDPVAEPYWRAPPGLLARHHHEVVTAGTAVLDTTSQDGYFLGAPDKFLGVKFQVGPDTHYGWVQLGLDALASEGTITGYGWNDTPDGPIAAGDVPEPSSLALLALGAAGVAARRRKKRSA